MSYFKDFNLVRAITLLSFIGAGVLGWFDWKQYQELRALRPSLAVDGDVEDLSRDLQTLALQYVQLDRERQGEGFLAQANPDEYILKNAAEAQIGQLDIKRNSQEARGMRGVEDVTFRITPEPPAPVRRSRIKDFFSKLEENSQRIRVTTLEIENSDPKIPPQEVPPDKWNFTCTLTSRQKSQ